MSDKTVNAYQALKDTYVADNIGGKRGILGIREDISRYLADKYLRGILQMLREIVENSLDEGKDCVSRWTKIPGLENKEFNILVRIFKDGSIFIKDEGRGIPCGLKDIEDEIKGDALNLFHYDKGKLFMKNEKGEWIEALEYKHRIAPAIIHALENDTIGGKGNKGGDTKGYQVRTGGVHGAGACVTLAGCEFFRVINTSTDTNKSWKLEYERGIKTCELTEIDLRRKPNGEVDYGYSVHMKYDDQLFDLIDANGQTRTFPYDIDEVKRLFRNYAIANSRINIHFEYELPDGTKGKEEIKCSDYNAEDLLMKQSLTKKIYKGRISQTEDSDTKNPLIFDLEIYATHTSQSSIMNIVNMLLVERSPVIKAFQDCLRSAVYERFRKSGSLHPKIPPIIEVERYWASAILILDIENPEFSGQVKHEFSNSKLHSLLNIEFENFFKNEGKDLVSEVYSRVFPAYQEQLRLYASREEERKKRQESKNISDAIKNTKYNTRLYVPDADYRNCILIIIEGDTANEILLNAINSLPKIFATFYIKGRISNVILGNELESMDSEMYKELHAALSYPWRRVVFMTDGDADGWQIRDLLLIFFMEKEKYRKEYILRNRLSMIQAPIMKFTVEALPNQKVPGGTYPVYIFTKEGIEPARKAYEGRIKSVESFKGLGAIQEKDIINLLAMDSRGDLNYEYIIQPTSRDMEEERELYDKFYGQRALHRQDYIRNNFCTSRLQRYFDCRKDRIKDLSVSVDLTSTIRGYDKEIINTGSLLDNYEDFSEELDQTVVTDLEYHSPIENLMRLREKYGDDVDVLITGKFPKTKA